MEPYKITDDDGDLLIIGGAADGGLIVGVREGGKESRMHVPAVKLADLVVAMRARSGQPAPVITARLPIDTSGPHRLGPFLLSAEGRRVRTEFAEHSAAMHRDLEPHVARQLAGWLVTYADAAEEPDPADVEALARLIEEGAEGRTVHPHGGVTAYADTLAAHLLRSGVRLPGEDGSNG